MRRAGGPVGHRLAGLRLRLARGPYRAVANGLREHAAARRPDALRARRQRPHRRRYQSAGQAQAQPLDRRPRAGCAGMARQRPKCRRQLVAGLERLAARPCRRVGRGTASSGQRRIRTHRSRPRALRQGKGRLNPGPSSSPPSPKRRTVMTDIVIVAAQRTAVGKFGGTLARTPAPELGAHVVKGLLAKAGVAGDAVSEVIMGQVLTAGSGQNPARQTVIKAGLPNSVPALTINKVCGSGLKAVMLAAQAVRCGYAEIVVAGGQENMSASPHVLMNSREGNRMGEWKLLDSMIVDGLWDVYNQYHMGTTAENVA